MKVTLTITFALRRLYFPKLELFVYSCSMGNFFIISTLVEQYASLFTRVGLASTFPFKSYAVGCKLSEKLP